MKIAIAAEGNSVSMHFGHCEGFMIYDIENKQIKSSNFVPNPGHRPGYLPEFLKDKGISCIIAGGMGGGAIELFNNFGIDVITGAEGNTDEIIKKYIDGTLVSTVSACEKHEHEGHCED